MEELGKSLSSRYDGHARLTEGIHLKDLVENFQSEFTLDASQADASDESLKENRIDSVFDYNDFAPYINLDCVNTGEDEDETPFEQLRKKMTPITEDGKVLKVILKHGSGEVIPPTCVIYYHYNCYFEMEEIPFDSSYLRSQKPMRMHLGVDGTYHGFQLSLLSMKVGEKSQFLIHPSYAFGSMGAPPRIPPNATILLEIELLKMVDCGALNETIDLSQEEMETFSECYNKAKAYHVLGNDFFQQKNLKAAIENYRKAEIALLRCKMNNDDEEEKCKRLLLKIYVNMCVIYNNPKMKSPEKVCNVAREAFLTCTKLAAKSAKLHFCVGRAEMALSNFDKARMHFKKSLSLEPHNEEISSALAELEERNKKYHDHEKITYQKALGFKSKKEPQSKKPDDEFVNAFKNELQLFAASSRNRLQLPPGLTREERLLCKEISEELGLTYEDTLICGKHSIAVVK